MGPSPRSTAGLLTSKSRVYRAPQSQALRSSDTDRTAEGGAGDESACVSALPLNRGLRGAGGVSGATFPAGR